MTYNTVIISNVWVVYMLSASNKRGLVNKSQGIVTMVQFKILGHCNRNNGRTLILKFIIN